MWTGTRKTSISVWKVTKVSFYVALLKSDKTLENFSAISASERLKLLRTDTKIESRITLFSLQRFKILTSSVGFWIFNY